MKTLSIPEQHQLRIAQKVLREPEAMTLIMGGMTKAEAVQKIMNQPTIYEVRRKNRKAGGHFFDESTLRFFGDTISDYAVKDGFVIRKKDGKRWRIMPNYRLHPAE